MNLRTLVDIQRRLRAASHRRLVMDDMRSGSPRSRFQLVKRVKSCFFSQSQLSQDLFALTLNGFPADGWFVDIGASHPSRLSNTYLLERHFGWKGVLVEPNPEYKDLLRSHRGAPLSTRPLWSAADVELEFEMKGTRSTLVDENVISVASERKTEATVVMQTTDWDTFAREFELPSFIHYLSLDTEGSEYEILSGIDFARYSFGLISVEHNYTRSRELILSLLAGQGYTRVLEKYSMWDDFYIRMKPQSL